VGFSTYAYPGFDTTKTGEIYTQAALDFVDANLEAGRSFYLYYNSQAVHVPHTPATFFETPVEGTQLSSHLDMVKELDLQVGVLVARFVGVANNTLFMFTSDNVSARTWEPGMCCHPPEC